MRELEARMLPLAAKNTPSRFEQSVRRTRERLNPETMAARHAAAIEKRGTELAPEADGMAFVGAHVAAVVGVAIDDRLTTIARTLQCDGETRTLSELKADVFADILLDNHHVDNAAARHPAGQATARSTASAASAPPCWSPTPSPESCSPSTADATGSPKTSEPGYGCGMEPAGSPAATPAPGTATSTTPTTGHSVDPPTTTTSPTNIRYQTDPQTGMNADT
jgi:hypothetical protein